MARLHPILWIVSATLGTMATRLRMNATWPGNNGTAIPEPGTWAADALLFLFILTERRLPRESPAGLASDSRNRSFHF